jgi:hypothetical protein
LEGRSGEVARLWKKVGVIEYRILEGSPPDVDSHQANKSAPAAVKSRKRRSGIGVISMGSAVALAAVLSTKSLLQCFWTAIWQFSPCIMPTIIRARE